MGGNVDNIFGDVDREDIKEDMDQFDSEASPITAPGQKRRFVRNSKAQNNSGQHDKQEPERISEVFDMMNNSLNTSNIETEGQIGPSPKK